MRAELVSRVNHRRGRMTSDDFCDCHFFVLIARRGCLRYEEKMRPVLSRFFLKNPRTMQFDDANRRYLLLYQRVFFSRNCRETFELGVCDDWKKFLFVTSRSARALRPEREWAFPFAD